MSLVKFLSRSFDGNESKEFYTRYKNLGYTDLQKRYVNFVQTNNPFKAISEESIHDPDLRARVKAIRSPSTSALVHRVVLMELESESEKATALRFSDAVAADDEAALQDIFTNYDKQGRYKALYQRTHQH